MTQDRWDRFWVVICGFEQALRVLFIMLTIFFLLTIVSFLVIDRDTGTYLIVLYNLVVFGIGLLTISVIVRKCSSRDMQY